jgi:LPXTG-motif cell wall-anchored protein
LRKTVRGFAAPSSRVALVPPDLRRVVAALLAGAALGVPTVARGQSPVLPEDGVEVSTTPPVPLAQPTSLRAGPSELPSTGSEPGMLFLMGLALTLIGSGLRLRTADADDY